MREKKEKMKEGRSERREREGERGKEKISWVLYNILGVNLEV